MAYIGTLLNKSLTMAIAICIIGIPTFFSENTYGDATEELLTLNEGDWIVVNTTIIENDTITLNGNLIIESGGNLTLVNTTILFNSSFDGQYGIYVREGGELHVTGSKSIIHVDPEEAKDITIYLGEGHGYLYIFEYNETMKYPQWEQQGFVKDVLGEEVGVSSRAKPTFADLDNDEDQDLTLGTDDGILIYYENTGTQMNPVWSRDNNMFSDFDLGSDGASSPVFIDLDNDGDLDCCIGKADGMLCYFRNIGSISNPVWEEEETMFEEIDAGQFSTPTFSDIDGDDDYDLTIGSFNEGLFHFENIGTNEQPQWSENTSFFKDFHINSYSCPNYFDADEDDDLDLAVGEVTGEIKFFRNIGTKSNPKWRKDHSYFAGINFGNNAAPAIYRKSPSILSENHKESNDNKSVVDLLFGTRFGDLKFFENEGTAQTMNLSYNKPMLWGVDIGAGLSPEFGDLDGDGDQDLLVSRKENFGDWFHTIIFMENIGDKIHPYWIDRGKILTTSGGMIGSVDFTFDPTLGDLDGDGDLDLTLGFFRGGLKYYENVGNPYNAQWELKNGVYDEMNTQIRWIPTFVDLDDDEDLDLIMGSTNGSITYYTNDGTTQQSAWERETTIFQEIHCDEDSAPEFADIDNDGDFDLFIGTKSGWIGWYNNTGDVKIPKWTYVGRLKDGDGMEIWEGPNSRLAFADVGDWSNDNNYDESRTIWHHLISSDNNYTMVFEVEQGGIVEIIDMQIRNCGMEKGKRGLIIKSDNAIFTGNCFERNHYGIVLNAQNSTIISNNTFTNNNIAILIQDGSNHVIQNNEIKESEVGILLENSSNNLIIENEIFYCFTGIYLSKSHGNTIENCTMSSCDLALKISQSSSNNIKCSIIQSCSEGIQVANSLDHTFFKNTLLDCGMNFLGKNLTHYSSHTIENNTVNGKLLRYYVDIDNVSIPNDNGQLIIVNSTNIKLDKMHINSGDIGILLAFATNCIIANSEITNCTYGIIITQCFNISLYANIIAYNERGVMCTNFSQNIKLFQNSITFNTLYGVDSSENDIFQISANWNYWGHSSGPNNPTYNPNGLGNNVSYSVNFAPWLRSEPGDNIWYVNGSAQPGGIGTISNPFTTIQQAIDNASLCETIHIHPGVYRENLVIPIPIKLFGPDGRSSQQAIIDSMGGIGINVNANSVITNLTIMNASCDISISSDAYVYNTTFTSIEYKSNSSLNIGYYLDVLLQDKKGSPLANAIITIESKHNPSQVFISDKYGQITTIPLLEQTRNAINIVHHNSYYLNATSSIGHDNYSLSIHSNEEIILNLSRKGSFGEVGATADLDGDGYLDYVVGAPDDSISSWQSGAVFIYWGSSMFTNKQLSIDNADKVIFGDEENHHFGYSLAVNDIDRDGREDLIVTARGKNSTRCEIYLFSGEIMQDRSFGLLDAVQLKSPENKLTSEINEIIETIDINCDGFSDVLIGCEDGLMVFQGQLMITKESFQKQPILSEDWDPIICGNGGEMRLESGLMVDTYSNIDSYAFAMMRERIIEGFAFSISIEPGSGTEVISVIDHKVNESNMENSDYQRTHSLFRLQDDGKLFFKPNASGSVKYIDLMTQSEIFKFTFIINIELQTLSVFTNGKMKLEVTISDWENLYVKLGDSNTQGGLRTALIYEFTPFLYNSLLPGVSNCVRMNVNDNEYLAMTFNEEIHLIPLVNGWYSEKRLNLQEEFIGLHNHTLFNNGITLNPYNIFSLIPNGNFSDGWDHWYQTENEQGRKTAGRWWITNETVGNWFTCLDATGGFGSDKDLLWGDQIDCDGRLRSENVTIPETADFLSFWYHWVLIQFDLEQDNYPDSASITFRNASDDSVVLTLTEFVPDGPNRSIFSERDMFIDISSLCGMTVYLSLDIITNNDTHELGLIQIDEVKGVEVYDDLIGEFISDIFTLEDEYTSFYPTWELIENNGSVEIYYRSNESDIWYTMVHEQFNSVNCSTFQYKVKLIASSADPYPVLKSLNFTFYQFDEITLGNGTPFEVGNIYNDYTLAIIDSKNLTVYNGTDVWLTITADFSIESVTSVGDINGDSISDLFISSNDTVYMVFMQKQMGIIHLEDANYSFSGPEGFGQFLNQHMVGSPLEGEKDGLVYLLPIHLEDCAVLDVNLENNSYVYPDSNIALNLSLYNRGLLNASSVLVEMIITNDLGYIYNESTEISLDSWTIGHIVFDWEIPQDEQAFYNLTFMISPDNNNLNNVLQISVISHYHAILVNTSKDYDAVRPYSTLQYNLTLTNLGTLGSDNITIDCHVPVNWSWRIKIGGENISGVQLHDCIQVQLLVYANSSLGEYSIQFVITSENEWTTTQYFLMAYLVDQDITPTIITTYRDDGKQAQLIAEEASSIQLILNNTGIQSVDSFEVVLIVNTLIYETKEVSGIPGDEYVGVNFNITLLEGIQTILFIVDPQDCIKEYNETNNELRKEIFVRPEIAITPFSFLIHVTNIQGKVVPDVTVSAKCLGIQQTNMTNRHGNAMITIQDEYMEGCFFTIEVLGVDLYAKSTVRIYSEDAQIELNLTAGLYSIRMRCDKLHRDILPGGSQSFRIEISNLGDFNDSYTLSLNNLPLHWDYTISNQRYFNDILNISKNEIVALDITLYAWQYAPAYNTIEMLVSAESFNAPVSDTTISFSVTILLVENITVSAETTNESGIPGDSISYQIGLRNEGNIKRNVTLFIGGNSDYGELSRDTFILLPGASINCWLVVKLQNLPAGTVLNHHVVGLIENIGSTQKIEFNTSIIKNTQNSRLSVLLKDGKIFLMNLGNDHELFEVNITSPHAMITPEIPTIFLDIGQEIALSVDIVMKDMTILVGDLFQVNISLFDGQIWHNTTHFPPAPAVHDFIIIADNHTVMASPGTNPEFILSVKNTGNIQNFVVFHCSHTGYEYLTIPAHIKLEPSETIHFPLKYYLPYDAQGTRDINLTGIIREKQQSINLQLIIDGYRQLTLDEVSVKNDGPNVKYTLSLVNTGDVTEIVSLSTNVGYLDNTNLYVAIDGNIQFHLIVPSSVHYPEFIIVNATSQYDETITSLKLLPPPAPEILISRNENYTVGDQFTFSTAGNYKSVTWTIESKTYSGDQILHYFTSSGTHLVQLTVTDHRTLSVKVVDEIVIQNLPPNIVINPFLTGFVGKYVILDALNVHDPDGTIQDMNWIIDNESYQGRRINYVFNTAGIHNISFSATDNDGAMNSTILQISVLDTPSTPPTVSGGENSIAATIFTISFFLTLLAVAFCVYRTQKEETSITKRLYEIKWNCSSVSSECQQDVNGDGETDNHYLVEVMKASSSSDIFSEIDTNVEAVIDVAVEIDEEDTEIINDQEFSPQRILDTVKEEEE